jgi:DNA-binding PadR family transcriptional regulator
MSLFAPKDLLKLILLYLASRGPVRGSEAMKWVEGNTVGLWRPSPGSVYPLLKRMHAAGLLREVGVGGQRAYVATRAGLQELLGHMSSAQVRRHFALFTLYLKILGPSYEQLASALARFVKEDKAKNN